MFNEERGAEICVRRVCPALAAIPYPSKLITVDDGSRDQTGAILDRLVPEFPNLAVLHHSQNGGYGAALRTGIQKAAEQGFDYALFMDSDLTNDPADIPKFVAQMEQGIDVIKASRFIAGGRMDGVPWQRSIFSVTGNLVARPLFHVGVRDCSNGFRAVKVSILQRLNLQERGFPIIVEELYQAKFLARTYAQAAFERDPFIRTNCRANCTLRPERTSKMKKHARLLHPDHEKSHRQPALGRYSGCAIIIRSSLDQTQSLRRRRDSVNTNDGSLTMRNVSLRMIIEDAYDLKRYTLTAPDWTGTERFDIKAKVGEKVKHEELRLMLQSLLAERFQLKAHRELKEMTGYALLPAKSGFKLKPAEGNGSSINSSRGAGKVKATCKHVSMPRLADYLSGRMDHPVVDQSGISDAYDFILEWSPDQIGEDAGPSIFTALTEQLGLRLETRKLPVSILVVDSISKTQTEN